MEPNSYMEMKELERLDDPSFQNRCTRLKRKSCIQSAAGQGCVFLVVGAFYLYLQGYLGTTSRSGHFYPPVPALIPWAHGVTAAIVVVLGCCLCIKNFYLVDPVDHELFHRFSFLGWRRWRTIFRQGDVWAVAVAGQRRSSKYRSYWVYRVVAVGKNGRQEALCDWRSNGLDGCNILALVLARGLNCQGCPAPQKSKLVVEMESGLPMVRFTPYDPNVSPALASVLILSVVVFVVILVFSVISRRH